MPKPFDRKENTHQVFKRSDAEKYLTDGELRMLRGLLRNIEESRVVDGKRTTNQYYICNTDEPYAAEVLAVIKKGEEAKE